MSLALMLAMFAPSAHVEYQMIRVVDCYHHTPVALYSDASMTTALPNPFVVRLGASYSFYTTSQCIKVIPKGVEN